MVEKEKIDIEDTVSEDQKEELPVTFITDWVSKGWEEVGVLQATIKDLNEVFIGGKKVGRVLQDLADAYLLCIGQLELHLHDNDYLDGTNDEDLVIETEPEVIDDNIDDEPCEVIDANKDGFVDDPAEQEMPVAKIDIELIKGNTVEDTNITDYFVDFDDADLSEPRITDDELDKLYKRAR